MQIFSPPKIQDSELNRSAFNLFRIILWVMGIITLTFLWAILWQRQFAERYVSIILITCTVSMTLLFFLNKGYVKATAYFYIIFLLLMVLGFDLTGGGIKGHGAKLLPVVVMFAGLTIGRKAIWLFGIIASVGGFMLVLADYYNLLSVKEPLGQTPVIYWMYSVTTILLFCYLEYLSIGGLNKALSETKQELILRKQSEEKYRLIFESFQDIYYQTNMQGEIIIITPSVKTHTGYTAEEVIGRNVSEFYHDPKQKRTFMDHLITSGSLQNYELDLLSKNGNIINTLISSHVHYDAIGNPNAIEGTIHDITQRKVAEDKIIHQNGVLYEVAFLQSHIVRRPVASVLGLLNLINKEDPGDPLNFEVIPKLEIASRELDDVIRQIIKKTEEITGGEEM